MSTATADPDTFPGDFSLDMTAVRSVDDAIAVLEKYAAPFALRSAACRDNAIVGLASMIESRGLATNARAEILCRVRSWFGVKRTEGAAAVVTPEVWPELPDAPLALPSAWLNGTQSQPSTAERERDELCEYLLGQNIDPSMHEGVRAIVRSYRERKAAEVSR